MAATGVRILSRRMIRPEPQTKQEQGEERQRIHLTPWDLRLISLDYIQMGVLFYKPHPQQQKGGGEAEDPIISGLLSSFARALDHFFPLAGRLATINHDTSPPSLSIFLGCSDEGAEFIHASAADIAVSDILTPLYIPPIVHSFFPLNGAIGHDGHSMPLLAVQVTELADGIFIACSLNHAVADGTSLWHFTNSWSEIARTGITHPPVLDRWFPESCPPPIRLPFRDHRDFIRRPVYAPVNECFFHFSAQSVAQLKAKANAEMGTHQISSLQALLAHTWRSVTRARVLEPQQETAYLLLVGCRSRLNPQLPEAYLGNSVVGVPAKATVGDVVGRGLGWAALLLNQAIASEREVAVGDKLELWTKNPSFAYIEQLRPGDLATGSSPRFNIYGNDFGWGRPVAVRSGCGNKFDGKVTVYAGAEEGSMALEVCLSSQALSSLVEDMEFMEAVSNA